MNAKSLQNLEQGRWHKGQSGNPVGKPKLFKNIIKDMPVDAKTKIYAVLHYVISLPSMNEVKKFAENTGTLEYGAIIQVACKELLSKANGWRALNDILNRLFGTPRVQAEVTHQSPVLKITVRNEEIAEKLKRL